MVSKKWVMLDASFDFKRLTVQALDFDFLSFLLMMASLICSPPKRNAVRRTTRASAAVGFEPTPTPEVESQSGFGDEVAAMQVAPRRTAA